MIRLGESLLGQSYYQGFNPAGTCGVFGAATAAACIMGLEVLRAKYALGIAGSFCGGTMECTGEGAGQKPLQAGHPAMGEVVSASLAQMDFIGAGTVFDGPYGLIKALSYKDQYDYGRITETLGNKWEMTETSIKVHACCRFSAPVADCAIDLYRQGVRSNNVKQITAKVGEFSVKMLCNPIDRKLRPQTHVDAQFSLPYAIAVALCKNSTGIREFSAEAIGDREVLALAEKVRWELDPDAEKFCPKAYPATVIAELNDGKVFQAHVDYPKGDPENPASDEEIVTKFNSLTEPYMERERREKIADMVMGLEKIGIAELAELVR